MISYIQMVGNFDEKIKNVSRRLRRRFFSPLQGLVEGFFALVWSMLPLKIKANLLEKDSCFSRLNWQRGHILMGVNSYQAMRRLDALKSEPYTAAWIENDIMAGDVFYDIGASTGPFSLLAFASTGGKAKVYAFEPVASSFALLVGNVSINDASGLVVPLKIALADRTGFTSFAYGSLSAGTTKHPGLLPPTAFGILKNLGTREIFSELMYVWALDDFVERAKILLPTHVKIDVDGSEVGVLSGARKVLSNPNLRLVQVEVRKGDGGTVEGVFTIMRDAGFKLIAKYRDESQRAADYLFRRT